MHFAEPDLEIVAMSVAARHSDNSGSGIGTVVSQPIRHLNRDTACVAILNTPKSARHALQEM